MKQENMRLDRFFEQVKGGAFGNNHVYRVRVELDDGTGPLVLSYESPRGMNLVQEERIGTTETTFQRTP